MSFWVISFNNPSLLSPLVRGETHPLPDKGGLGWVIILKKENKNGH